MTTVRELCRVLATALHVPGVDRWAEQLVSREFLPGLDHEVTALDAALLLAAVVAAPRPDAPDAKQASDGFWCVCKEHFHQPFSVGFNDCGSLKLHGCLPFSGKM